MGEATMHKFRVTASRVLWVCLAKTIGSSLAMAQSSWSGPPDALVRALEARKSFDHALIEWRIDFHEAYPGNSAKAWYMTSKYANGDQVCITHGDASGCRQPGNAGEYWACSEERMLIKDNREWLYLEDTTTVTDVGDWDGDDARRFGYTDVRTLGFFPYDAPLPLDSCLSFRGPTAYYEQTLEDGLYVVTRHFPSAPEGAELLVKWWIDPRKDWCPTRVAMTDSEGRMIVESTCTLEKFGDTWFPARSNLRQNGEDYCEVVVERAVFNAPELIPEVGFKDLSLMPGILIGGREDIYGAFWDGEHMVDRQTWARRLQDGTVDTTAYKIMITFNQTEQGHGRYPKRNKDGFWIISRPPSREPGLWENYVQRFIQIAGLNEGQTTRAWEALRKHQKTALKWLGEHEDLLKGIDADIAKVETGLAESGSHLAISKPPRATPGPAVVSSEASTHRPGDRNGAAAPVNSSNPETLRKDLAGLEERRTRLLDPIDEIFRTKLQPDLFALLTPEQKESLAKRKADLDALKDAAKKESPVPAPTP